MNYDIYLFSCLVKLYDDNFRLQPYDVQFDVVDMYYHHFEISEFNNEDDSLHDCIVKYLQHHFNAGTLGDFKKIK